MAFCFHCMIEGIILSIMMRLSQEGYPFPMSIMAKHSNVSLNIYNIV